jgi:hypothetical protein
MPPGTSPAMRWSRRYSFGGIETLIKKYNPQNLQTGFHRTADGEEFYFISNPATGLWKSADERD